MENAKMKKQTYQQQETHGKTTNRIRNKDKNQTNKLLLSPKAGSCKMDQHKIFQIKQNHTAYFV
jgi:hypothetical protein